MEGTTHEPNGNSTWFNLTAKADEEAPGGQQQNFTDGVFTAVSVYLLLLAFIGIPGNGAILYMFARNKSLRNPMNAIFVNLAVSDLIISLCGTLTQSLTTWGRFYARAGHVACNLYGFSVYLGGEASLFTLTLIAVERYLTVIRPFSVGALTYWRASGALVFVWLFALLWSVGPLLGWSSYIPEGLGTWCSINWWPENSSNVSYMLLMFILSFFIPVFLIVGSYVSVWKKVKEIAQSTSATESSVKAERAVAKMSCLMVIFFLIAWSPYAITAMAAVFGPSGVVTNVHTTLPSLFAKSSCVYNPIIYIGMNKAFRHTFFMSLIGRDPFVPREKRASSDPDVTVGHSNKVAPLPQSQPQ